MAGDFEVVKSLVGDTWELGTATANEILEAGDLCNFDADGELEKVDDQDTAHDLVVVLEDAIADQTDVPFVWCDPWILFEATQTGTIGDVGDLLEVDVTSTVSGVAPATSGALARFMLREVVDATAKTVRVTRVWNSLT